VAAQRREQSRDRCLQIALFDRTVRVGVALSGHAQLHGSAYMGGRAGPSLDAMHHGPRHVFRIAILARAAAQPLRAASQIALARSSRNPFARSGNLAQHVRDRRRDCASL
jgi:hypothetical protein